MVRLVACGAVAGEMMADGTAAPKFPPMVIGPLLPVTEIAAVQSPPTCSEAKCSIHDQHTGDRRRWRNDCAWHRRRTKPAADGDRPAVASDGDIHAGILPDGEGSQIPADIQLPAHVAGDRNRPGIRSDDGIDHGIVAGR